MNIEKPVRTSRDCSADPYFALGTVQVSPKNAGQTTRPTENTSEARVTVFSTAVEWFDLHF